MKKIIILSTSLSLCALGVFAQPKPDSGVYALVPKPAHLTEQAGFYNLTGGVKIEAPLSLKDAAALLKDALWQPAALQAGPTSRVIRFLLQTRDTSLGPEGYRLTVAPSVITITSKTPEGAIHGLFTLLQLQELQP